MNESLRKKCATVVNVRSGEAELIRVKTEAIASGRETMEEGGTIQSREEKRTHENESL